MEWYHVCWPRLTAKCVEPAVSISWASCLFNVYKCFFLFLSHFFTFLTFFYFFFWNVFYIYGSQGSTVSHEGMHSSQCFSQCFSLKNNQFTFLCKKVPTNTNTKLHKYQKTWIPMTTIIIDLVFRGILQCRRQNELFQQTSHVVGLKASIYFL